MKKKLIFLIIIIIIFDLKSVSAVGILSPGERPYINFKPNLEKTITYGVNSNMAIPMEVSLSVGGDLAQYVKLSQDSVFLNPGETKYFSVTINFPSEIEATPGENRITVSATENPPRGAGITAVASVKDWFTIFIPYPGKYAIISFEVNNVNETANFKVIVQNLGKDNVDNAKASIDIFGPSEAGFDKKIATLFTEEKAVKGESREELYANLNTAGYYPGEYKAVATINFDSNSTVKERLFKIGSLDIKIINNTVNFQKNSINKFDIEIESRWNNKIENVYAEVMIYKDNQKIGSLKTSNTDLNPWEKKILTTYWDTGNLGEGEYDSTISLHYNDRITAKDNKLYIMFEKEEFSFNITTLLAVIIAILIIADVLWILKRKSVKRKKK